MLKFPNISKICVAYKLFKKQENGLKIAKDRAYSCMR